MRAALYARTSTTDQHPENQLDELRRYAKARSVEIVEEYVDRISGAKDRRPALDRLLADARRRRFDAVVITKLDRLARSVRHLTALAGEFAALGIDLVVVDQSLDTSTPAGRLLFHTLSAVAEFERDLIRERVRSGLQAARRRGSRIGRPRALVNHGKVAELARSGLSGRAIARELGVSEFTVRGILRRCEKNPLGEGYSDANNSAVPIAARGCD